MEVLIENDKFRLTKVIRGKFGTYEIEQNLGYSIGWCLVFKVNSLPVAYKLFQRLTSGLIHLNIDDILED